MRRVAPCLTASDVGTFSTCGLARHYALRRLPCVGLFATDVEPHSGLRGPGESYSDVIVRLAKGEGGG
jgi:hypothetical protein